MKKQLLFAILLISLSYVSFAQSFEFVDDENVVISGTTVIIPSVVSGTYEPHLTVRSTAGAEVSARISKTYIAGPVEGSYNNMCTPITTQSPLGTCVTGTQTPVFILNPGEISGPGHLYFEQGSNTGVTTIQYKVFNVNNESDFRIINLSFSTVTSVNTSQVKSFNVYPNPANGNFTIEHNYGSKAVVEVFNVLGKSVAKINSDSDGRISIDCGKWENGYYFCRLYNEGKIEKTVKLVVTH